MLFSTIFRNNLAEHRRVMEEMDALEEEFAHAAASCVEAISGGGKIMFFGNGGSASDAQHLATELSVRYIKDRPAIAAIAITTDSSVLTATANDMGYEEVFARQIEALGRPGDVAIGISTSGKSPNVLRALDRAKTQGMVTIGLSGADGGPMKDFTDHILEVPSRTTARIQEMHITLGHMLCAAIEQKLGLVEE
ncbi:D-sedoheptulose 7-phosphate isomerase [Parvibaculum sp.]|uniref:D-sedoheptulose 7-phosphate isomerase n=1 Tax=Parvibaculum sp. TaxID=2024848 RepID=UPI000C8D50BE|nr:D-sedoheptulose 7-phosphate isomerase [Parvibaculum sp.]MAB15369.1 phosphoheptose isomerase [Parvibaculum sp.]